MKYAKILLLSLAAGACLLLPVRAAEAPEVSAASAVLVDYDTGRALWEKNADDPRLIASTTKILTALIVLERCDLGASVVIDPAWTGIEGSSMYLKPGQELTVRELLYGLMLASGNDAAVALACVAAGSVESFVELMNARAAELGCVNAHFDNPSGLDGTAHYASARDLARITREALRNEDFRRIVSTVTASAGGQTYTNHNRLLRECEGVFGVKTGYTEAAGRTLVTCCEREGQTLICVTLSDTDDWADHAALYDWAYAEFVRQEALSPETSWTIPVIGGTAPAVTVTPLDALSVFCRPGETLTVRTELPGFVYASIAAGDPAGTAAAYLNGELVGSVTLTFDHGVCRITAEPPTIWTRLAEIFRSGERKIYTLS